MILHNLTLAKTAGTSRDKREAWIYFISGQSLAVGNALKSTLSPPLNAPIPNAYIYYKPNSTTDNAAAFATDNGNWEQLTTENNQLTDIAAQNWYGPELKMAYDLQTYYKRDIFIIKFAIGDTALGMESTQGVIGQGGLLDWDKDSVSELFHRTFTDYWIPARDKLLSYGRIPIAKGWLWEQGGRDALLAAQAAIYNPNLVDLLLNGRLAVGNPNMHCAIGQININLNVRPHFNSIKAAQISVAALANNSLIDEDAYTMSGDNVHYAEYNTLGADAAAAFIAANP
jgi:hypothetical protein